MFFELDTLVPEREKIILFISEINFIENEMGLLMQDSECLPVSLCDRANI